MCQTIDVKGRQYMSMLKNSAIKQEDPDEKTVKEMSSSIRQKLSMIIQQQNDDAVLKSRALPKVMASYTGPVVAHHDTGKKLMIVGNEEHSAATNNGYHRNALGGFFAH